MTVVRVPLLKDGSGAVLDSAVSAVLVDSAGDQVIGFGPVYLATENRTESGGVAVDLPLTPQSQIALPPDANGDPVPTWYSIVVSSRNAEARYLVQVPVSSLVVDLETLIGAAAIDPADLPAQIVADTQAAAAAAAHSALDAAQFAADIAGMDASVDGSGDLIIEVGTLAPINAGHVVGPAGGAGPAGGPLTFIGSLSWAQISALVDPGPGDAYLLTAADAAAPERVGGNSAEAGDGIQWSGTAWVNVGGPLQGPAGADGADSVVPGPAGHSPVLTWVADQIAIDGAATGPHLTGPAGADGTDGDPGPGVPTGGTTGQVLAKKTNTAYDTEWVAQIGGSSNLALGETSTTAYRGDLGAAAYAHSLSAHAPADATAAGAAGDAFATSHLSAFSHSLIATALQPAAIGVSVQPYTAGLAAWASHTPGDYSASGHTHSGLYDALGAAAAVSVASIGAATAAQGSHADTALQPAAIGSTVQGYSATLTTLAIATAAGLALMDDTNGAAQMETLAGAAPTGSGGLVRSTSPTLVTPAIGTPVSGNLANCTGLPTAGVTGLDTALSGKEPAQAAASQAEAEAGTVTALRSWSPERVWQAIAAKVTAMLAVGVAIALTTYTEKRYAITTTGNVTIDLANGSVYDIQLDANRQITMPALPGVATATSFTLYIDCAGFTPTWNTSPTLAWSGGVPTLNTTSGKTNVLTFIPDYRHTRWIGMQSVKES